MLRGPKPVNRATAKTVRQLFAIASHQGVARKELASALGVAQSTVHHWAQGRSDVGVADLERMAKYMGWQVALQERK